MKNIRARMSTGLATVTAALLVGLLPLTAHAASKPTLWVGQKTIWGFNFTPGTHVAIDVTRYWYDSNGAWAGTNAPTHYHAVASKPYECDLAPASHPGLNLCWPPPAGGFTFTKLDAADSAPGAFLQVTAGDLDDPSELAIAGGSTGPCPAGTHINPASGFCS